MTARRVVLIIVVLFFVGAAAFAFFIGSLFSRPVTRTPSSTILVWDVPYDLPEIEPPAAGFPIAVSGYRPWRQTVSGMTAGIRRAASDARVKGIVLHVGYMGWGWTKVDEVRQALLDFRKSGKPVYASLHGGGEREYLLATAAETVTVPPAVPVQLDGLAAGALYFKGTFDKIGVSPNFEHVGRYKSAVEQYTHKGLSEPAREALDAVLDDIYDEFLEQAAEARSMSAELMRELVEAGPYSAADAEKLGLIDAAMFETDLDSLATRADGKREKTSKLEDFARKVPRPPGLPKIALVVADGAIAPGKSRVEPYSGRLLGAETIIEALKEAREERSVKAIVLRVNSPGGSAHASDDILREIERCKREKPIIVSMSDLAASGGYYIAMAADSIVAYGSTQTGSIGIYGGKFNIRGLYEKLGMSIDLVTRGPHAGILSPYTDWTPKEREIYHEQLASFYRKFIGHVAEQRGISVEQADSLGRGRVWSGRDAHANGLVDALGGLERAYAMARGVAGIDLDAPITVERFPRIKRSFLGELLEELIQEEDAAAHAFVEFPPVVQAWIAAARMPAGVALALMPWSLDAR